VRPTSGKKTSKTTSPKRTKAEQETPQGEVIGDLGGPGRNSLPEKLKRESPVKMVRRQAGNVEKGPDDGEQSRTSQSEIRERKGQVSAGKKERSVMGGGCE